METWKLDLEEIKPTLIFYSYLKEVIINWYDFSKIFKGCNFYVNFCSQNYPKIIKYLYIKKNYFVLSNYIIKIRKKNTLSKSKNIFEIFKKCFQNFENLLIVLKYHL